MILSRLPRPPRDYRRFHGKSLPHTTCLAYAVFMHLITRQEAHQLLNHLYWDDQGVAGPPGTTGF